MKTLRTISAIGALSAFLLLTGCTANIEAPTPSGPAAPPSSSSTLNGGTLSDNGVSIKEVSIDDFSVETTLDNHLTRVSPNEILLELGGSSGDDCQSNFSKLEVEGVNITLTHRVGDGSDLMCTMDYQFKYFLVESADGLADDIVFHILNDEGQEISTYTLTGDTFEG